MPYGCQYLIQVPAPTNSKSSPGSAKLDGPPPVMVSRRRVLGTALPHVSDTRSGVPDRQRARLPVSSVLAATHSGSRAPTPASIRWSALLSAAVAS
jgi:hypothetical protein